MKSGFRVYPVQGRYTGEAPIPINHKSGQAQNGDGGISVFCVGGPSSLRPAGRSGRQQTVTQIFCRLCLCQACPVFLRYSAALQPFALKLQNPARLSLKYPAREQIFVLSSRPLQYPFSAA